MKFCVIGSGSKGNMTYIETKKSRIIIDAGISFLDSSRRVSEYDFDLTKIDKIFITHHHDDHTKYLISMLKKCHAKVYITKYAFNNLNKMIKAEINNYEIFFIEEEAKYTFEDFEILTLQLSHDSKSILGYVIISEGKKLIYATDTGIFPVKYENLLKTTDGLIIEANHNVALLLESDRPADLKQRILSPLGHLSNQVTCEILQRVLLDQKVVILAHVSEECNSKKALTEDIINNVSFFTGKIEIAYQKIPTGVYEL